MINNRAIFYKNTIGQMFANVFDKRTTRSERGVNGVLSASF